MYYLATIQHTARKCPGVQSETFKDFLSSFSGERFAKAHIKMVGAYIDQSCFKKVLGAPHVSTFAVEAESVAKVNEIFGKMGAEVRQVLPWNISTIPGG